MNRVERLSEFYESLTEERLAGLHDLYHEDAHFRDPFNDVRGVPAIEAIFRHMFAQTDAPGFEVLHWAERDDRAYLQWRFRFGSRSALAKRYCIEGVSEVEFGADGRVVRHLDYWDPAAGLYEQLPLLGRLLKWLRRRPRRLLSRVDQLLQGANAADPGTGCADFLR